MRGIVAGEGELREEGSVMAKGQSFGYRSSNPVAPPSAFIPAFGREIVEVSIWYRKSTGISGSGLPAVPAPQ